MKIVHLITRADSVGGATVHVRDLAVALLAQGHEVTVLVGGEGPVTEEFARRGIPFRSLRNLGRPVRPLADFRAVLEIARVLRRMKPDLVATHTAKSGLVGRAASRIAGVPAVFTPHGWTIGDRISRRVAPVFRLAEKMAAPLARRIINVCEYEKQLALRHRVAPAEKLVVVHNGIPDLPTHFRANPARHPPRIVMVARFEHPKDHPTLLNALAGLRDHPWQLDLIGDGPLEARARRESESLGISGRVNFLGSRRDVPGRLAEAQIFALASRSEALPLSILEALRAGLPVIASDVGGVGEAVVPGINGFLSTRGDVETMRMHLAELATDPMLRRSMGAGARRLYEDRFTFERMLRQTLAVYAEALPAGKVSDGKNVRRLKSEAAVST
ncbi:MAG: glycosyltransferase family 4 protein [Acidobacteriota bacterium]|nr:glycosyltransferase family 4 protein [Acidobacteriota bacterium]